MRVVTYFAAVTGHPPGLVQMARECPRHGKTLHILRLIQRRVTARPKCVWECELC